MRRQIATPLPVQLYAALLVSAASCIAGCGNTDEPSPGSGGTTTAAAGSSSAGQAGSVTSSSGAGGGGSSAGGAAGSGGAAGDVYAQTVVACSTMCQRAHEQCPDYVQADCERQCKLEAQVRKADAMCEAEYAMLVSCSAALAAADWTCDSGNATLGQHCATEQSSYFSCKNN